MLWHRSVLPRIQRFLPARTIVEIGPGFGRWSEFLRSLCERLILVDVTERCVEFCRSRFAGDSRVECYVNDGSSLGMIADRSVDFIFSFDSLVHAEAQAVGAYLAEAARTLTPGGAGFVHHSNLGMFVSPSSGRVRWFVTARNWRAESMSAQVFRRQCAGAGLACRSQELINWIGRGPEGDRHRLPGRSMPLTDCLSIFTALPSRTATGGTAIVRNYTFADEWRQSVWIAAFYVQDRADASSPAAARPGIRRLVRKLTTARSVWRREGIGTAASIAWRRIASRSEFAASAIKARLAGAAARWFSAPGNL